MNLPNFLILGETKCGTTSLYNYLIQHPKIIETKGNHEQYDKEYDTKELRYFDRYYSKGINWYKDCFYTTKKGEITGEATPMYLYRTLSILRIKETVPDAKLIVLLRDPVARLYSNYNHNVKWVPQFKEKYPTFQIFWDSVHDSDVYLIEKGLYFYTLTKWFDHFDKSQFLILKSENLYNHTQKTYSEVLKFLEIEDFNLNEIKAFRKNDYQDLEKSMRVKLQNFYRPFNEKLYHLLENKFIWDY